MDDVTEITQALDVLGKRSAETLGAVQKELAREAASLLLPAFPGEMDPGYAGTAEQWAERERRDQRSLVLLALAQIVEVVTRDAPGGERGNLETASHGKTV